MQPCDASIFVGELVGFLELELPLDKGERNLCRNAVFPDLYSASSSLNRFSFGG